MDSTILEPMRIGGRELAWEIHAGIVRDLRRQQRAESRGGAMVLVTVTEFWISNPIRPDLFYSHRFEDPLVAGGQTVSVVHGRGAGDAWIALVNHDARTWRRVRSPVEFFLETGFVRRWRAIPVFLAWWAVFAFLAWSAVGSGVEPDQRALAWALFLPLAGCAAFVTTWLTKGLWWLFWVRPRARLLWREVEPRVERIAKALLDAPGA